MQEMRVQSLGWEESLEEGMATQSNILAWRIPWTEKPGRLQSIICKELDRTKATEHAYIYVEDILFMHPSIDGHVSGFCLGYYKQHCCDSWGSCIFWNQAFSLYTSLYDSSSHGSSVFSVWRNLCSPPITAAPVLSGHQRIGSFLFLYILSCIYYL